MMKTLFLHPPSFDGFDGGAGSRYQARREIKSFWYPTWLAQPAALLDDIPDARNVLGRLGLWLGLCRLRRPSLGLRGRVSIGRRK